ncbi:hypothetical protein EVAR_8904_1 [Eumeta japonica]|uniref:Uncharacterized protein n=1 Tax=Eumeta variegata TaxID=151549 RepID=A0A4C1U120_EUMVA|nr:hypothetical protein EVAR_8904_1 [Eumeta japonica]
MRMNKRSLCTPRQYNKPEPTRVRSHVAVDSLMSAGYCRTNFTRAGVQRTYGYARTGRARSVRSCVRHPLGCDFRDDEMHELGSRSRSIPMETVVDSIASGELFPSPVFECIFDVLSNTKRARIARVAAQLSWQTKPGQRPRRRRAHTPRPHAAARDRPRLPMDREQPIRIHIGRPNRAHDVMRTSTSSEANVLHYAALVITRAFCLANSVSRFPDFRVLFSIPTVFEAKNAQFLKNESFVSSRRRSLSQMARECCARTTVRDITPEPSRRPCTVTCRRRSELDVRVETRRHVAARPAAGGRRGRSRRLLRKPSYVPASYESVRDAVDRHEPPILAFRASFYFLIRPAAPALGRECALSPVGRGPIILLSLHRYPLSGDDLKLSNCHANFHLVGNPVTAQFCFSWATLTMNAPSRSGGHLGIKQRGRDGVRNRGHKIAENERGR